MAEKFEIEKFNGNNFSLWKLKMKTILTKDKCLEAISERPTEVTVYGKWAEMDKNAIANLHLALADGVIINLISNVLADYLVFDDVVAAILEEENRHSNREDKQTSSKQGNIASTSDDGNTLCCEAAVPNEGRKRFTDVWLFDMGATFHMTARREWFHQYKLISGGESVYNYNDHELKIIGIGIIMVKMHDGTVHTIRDVRHLNGEIMLEEKALVASHSPSHRVTVTWHQKLRHMSEQGMKILVERKLLPGLIKVSLSFCKHYGVSKQHRLKLKTSNSKSVCVLELVHSDVWKAPCLRTDNGGEYAGDEFDTLCKQKGIKRQFITAYTPQQNGVAEQMNRTLLERARAMLETASLEKSFWAKAVNTICYMINWSQSTAVKLKTLMEIKRPRWHLDYVMERNVAYCLLIEEGESSTLQGALNNPDASFWKEAMQEEMEALHKNKT
ncbi:gag-pol polyprotein [Tanacetum coccineum]